MQFTTTLLPVLSLLLTSLTQTAQAAPIFKKNENDVQFYNKREYVDYDSTMIRGVNIGSLFLLEPYITPSLFESFYDATRPAKEEGFSYGIPVDEYHYCQALGYEECANRLEAHWDSWYTEKDIQGIADMGLNLIRLPIGYWAFQLMEGDPYVTGKQEFYIDRMISWCAKYGIQVWIDLHGAAGSQNGFDNSGLRDNYYFQVDEYITVTQSVIKYMLQKYSADEFSQTIIGIELVNEPLGPVLDMDKLKDYYGFGYDYTRNTLGSNQILIMHDAFQPFHYWDDFMNLSDGFWGIVIDHHHYQVFSNAELALSIDQHVQLACSWGGESTKTESHWNVAGEWSAALTDCAKWLNGVGLTARYDGTFVNKDQTSSYIGTCEGRDDFSTWSPESIANSQRYIEAQLDAFEQRGGWIIWCHKTETLLEWDLQRLAYYGLFPQPVTHRNYPNQCGFSS